MRWPWNKKNEHAADEALADADGETGIPPTERENSRRRLLRPGIRATDGRYASAGTGSRNWGRVQELTAPWQLKTERGSLGLRGWSRRGSCEGPISVAHTPSIGKQGLSTNPGTCRCDTRKKANKGTSHLASDCDSAHMLHPKPYILARSKPLPLPPDSSGEGAGAGAGAVGPSEVAPGAGAGAQALLGVFPARSKCKHRGTQPTSAHRLERASRYTQLAAGLPPQAESSSSPSHAEQESNRRATGEPRCPALGRMPKLEGPGARHSVLELVALGVSRQHFGNDRVASGGPQARH